MGLISDLSQILLRFCARSGSLCYNWQAVVGLVTFFMIMHMLVSSATQLATNVHLLGQILCQPQSAVAAESADRTGLSGSSIAQASQSEFLHSYY